ncbi:response regulator transcription factor [Paracoccus sp. (in: a-proteobacteria)]|uniref:response regulator transcription factor n=1 Tax=Paracoccus sp. TaxID=267 RepID=UPI00289A83BA|nr:response regulator transcription factor [Paracoccus sp. (in: a-proteobacteria)]
MRVLLIEDDPGLGSALRDQVLADNHVPDWAQTLSEADDFLATTHYDLVLLDVNLPDGNGLDFLTQLRRRGKDMPIIMLTARDRVTDRITGLNAGADDYLIKPFDLAELSARIGAVARRYNGRPNPETQLGDNRINLAKRSVTAPVGRIDLSPREWAILEAFLQNPGIIMTKSRLEERLYAFDAEVESNTIEVYVSRLRKKLGRDSIETLRGLGYRLGQS